MKIALECKPDERLVMGLGVPRKKILHQNDKGDVCKFLSKNSGNIGLIDEDPMGSQPKLLDSFSEISNKYGIRHLKDPNNYIIIICPRLEDWIVRICAQSQINLSEYGLAEKPTTLARQINNKLPYFDRLIAALISLKNPPLLHLRSLLN